MIPLHYSAVNTGGIFVAVTLLSFVIYLLFLRALPQSDYDLTIHQFKIGGGLLAAAFVILVIEGRFDVFTQIAASYVFIYLVATIMLLRMLRYFRYNQKDNQLNHINLRYAVIIIALSFILSSQGILQTVSCFVYNIVFFLLYLIVLIISFILQVPFNYLLKLFGRQFNIVERMQAPHISFGPFSSPSASSAAHTLRIGGLIGTVLQVTTLLVLLLITVKLIIKIAKKMKATAKPSEINENRVFILKENKHAAAQAKPHKYDLSDPREKIRYYYHKFLEGCARSGIDILKSDTTLQINDKYFKKFRKAELIHFRNIYLHIRYRNDMPSSKDASEFKRLYHDILK